MASFVRQLNMYGFHKVVGIDTGGLKLDKDEMEFAHACFQRGREYLLDNIKRKISISKQEDTSPKPEIMSRVSDVFQGSHFFHNNFTFFLDMITDLRKTSLVHEGYFSHYLK